jgi:protein-disulfide isomerase
MKGISMKNAIRSLLAATMLCTAAIAPASAFDAAEREEIESILRDYLLANPEFLLEVQDAYERKIAESQREKQGETIASQNASIFEDPKDPVLGNPEGSVTVVEFFDYNCGYCKRAMSDMTSMMENDSELRFVLKEFPILGPESEEAHRVSYAFNEIMPEKYGDFHLRLLGFDGRANGDVAMRIATELGADEAAIRDRMDDDEISDRIRATYQLAENLGINGTPAYVVGDEVVSGALGESVLTTKVANVRVCGSTIC